jgi:hypothetical protein
MPITYCIVCNITGEKYYGSTITTLKVRLSKHKNKSNNCCSKQIIDRGDYDAYLLHEYETELEARMKEKWYIDNKTCINQLRVCLTDEEKKEYFKQYFKQYWEENKEEKKEYDKKYREKNREEKKQYAKQYYLKNREKRMEKVQCEFCGNEMNKGSLTRHKKKFHLFHFNAVFTN